VDDSIRFNPPEHEGILDLPFTLPQVAAYAAGGLATATGLLTDHTLAGLASGLLGLGVATIPWGEYRLVEWVPTIYRYADRRITGRCRYLEGGKFPGPLSDTKLLAEDGGIAVVRRGSMFTAAVAATSSSPALQDDDVLAADIATWAGIQRQVSLPSNHVARLTWVESAGPADPLGAIRWFNDNVSVPDEHGFAVTYRDAIGETSGAVVHRIYLTVSLDAKRAPTARAIKSNGGGELGAYRVLSRTVDWLVGELHVGRRTARAMAPAELRTVVRSRFDPAKTPTMAMLGDTASWTPAADFDGSRCYIAEGHHHITAKVIGLPEYNVEPDFLWPLLTASDHYRTVACVMDTRDPRKALASTERGVVTSGTFGDLKTRWGFEKTLRTNKKEAAAAVREEEMSHGHTAIEISMLVSVSSSPAAMCTCDLARRHPRIDPECLALIDAEQAYAEVETDAALSHVDLQRRWGQQRESFLGTLSLGRRA
jgi:hypothetical protein